MNLKFITTGLIILAYTLAGYCQEPKLLKKKELLQGGKAVYTVLKDNLAVKHGDYIVNAYSGNKKLVIGKYNNGQREGFWTERFYGLSSREIKSYGEYRNDSKTGIWIYYSFNGDTSQVFDYTSHTLVYAKNYHSDTSEYEIKTDTGSFKSSLDTPPLYIGGYDILFTMVMDTLGAYPQELNTKKTDIFKIFTVLIYTVDKNSMVTDIKFSEKIGYGYEERLTETLKATSGNWIPGTLNNSKVNVQLKIPIRMMYQF